MVPAVKFLAKKGMAFYGAVTGEGNTGDLVKLLSKYDKKINAQGINRMQKEMNSFTSGGSLLCREFEYWEK